MTDNEDDLEVEGFDEECCLDGASSENPDKYYRPTALELEQAVKGAQADDPVAIKRLYDWFQCLIRSIAYRQSIVSVLGEDAENIAWVLFYELIKDYAEPTYAKLPKYIKNNITWRITDIVKSSKYSDIYTKVDPLEVETATLDSYWDDTIENISLKQYLKELNPIQQKVLKLLFFYDYSRIEVAKILNIKLTAVKYHLKHGKKNLRAKFNGEGGEE